MWAIWSLKSANKYLLKLNNKKKSLFLSYFLLFLFNIFIIY